MESIVGRQCFLLDLTQFAKQIVGRSAATFNMGKTKMNFDLEQMSELDLNKFA